MLPRILAIRRSEFESLVLNAIERASMEGTDERRETKSDDQSNFLHVIRHVQN